MSGGGTLAGGFARLAQWLALAVFYPLAAWPVGRFCAQQNLAQNRARDRTGRPVLRQMDPETRWLRCGASTAGFAGCGPISVYNVLVLLGRPASLAEVIFSFERSRALALGGRAGSAPRAVGRALRRQGLACRRVRSAAALEKALAPGGAAVVMIWNKRGSITAGAHYFAVQKSADGGFAALNHQPQQAPALAGLIGGGQFAAGFVVDPPPGPE